MEEDTDSLVSQEEIPEEFIDEEAQVEQQIKQKRGFSQHFDSEIQIFGEKTTLTQIVVLLAYIRDMIQSKTPGDLKLSIGKNLDTDVFSFTVNGQEIPHIKAKKELEIN